MDLSARPLIAYPVAQPAARRIKLNSIWLLLARLITQAQLVVFTVLVARSLGVSGFGQYAFVASLIFVGNVVTTFGTDTLLIREVARSSPANGGLIAAAVWLQLALSVAWLAVVFSLADVLGGQSAEVALALKVYSLSLIPLAFFTVFTAILRAHERMDLYLLLNGLVAFIQLGGTWLALQPNGHLLSLMIALDMVQLAAAMSAGLLCRIGLPAFHFQWTATRGILVRVARLAWPFALLSVLAVIYQRLGVLMLTVFGTEAQTGWFAAATRVIEPAKMLHFAVLGALLPALARITPQAETVRQIQAATRVFRRSVFFLLAFSVLAMCVMIVLARPIVPLLFGADYAESVSVVQVMAVSLIPYTLSASLSVRRVTQGQERRVLFATAVSLCVTCLLNRWLIPGYGSIGAALAALGGESLLAGTLLMLRS